MTAIRLTTKAVGLLDALGEKSRPQGFFAVMSPSELGWNKSCGAMLYLHEGFSTLPCDAVVVAERAAEPRRLLTLSTAAVGSSG